jgi:hypothetical protein
VKHTFNDSPRDRKCRKVIGLAQIWELEKNNEHVAKERKRKTSFQSDE